MKILHLEDNVVDAQLMGEIVSAEFPECAIEVVESRDPFLAGLAMDPPPDLIISDFTLPSFDGLTALALVRERAPTIPFVFVSGSIGEERAIAAARAGAYDYVLKDNIARLPIVIRHALKESAQRRLRESDERRLREQADIIERASESIVLSDLNGRITHWNRGAEQFYGVPASEAVGRTLEELFPDAALQKPLRDRAAALATTSEWQGEITLFARDGREIVQQVHTTLVRDDTGQPKARLSIGTDVTEKKKIEEQFLRAQRLESLGLLAAGIAHDLNNILAPVLMAAPLLRQRITAAADLRVLDILEKSAERGSALVRQILGFAQGRDGGLRLIQVKHLLHDVEDVIGASFPKSITLDEFVAKDLWPIQGNPTQIHQILLNLAVNARDAMLPKGGTLRLRAENRVLDEADALALEGARPGQFLVLEVADTGTGMPAEVLARIWDPFFTTKREGEGTGLGLSTVRGIAAAHGGFIQVETRVGHGTSFRVFLPAAPAEDNEAADKDAPPALRGQGELIMIVDDEIHVRDLTSAILSRHGYRVISCGDGVEAVGLFTEHSGEIRAVISDINMPNLDGPALALILCRLKPDIKILTMTGVANAGSVGSHPSGAPPILQKPFTLKALLTAVHQMLYPGVSTHESCKV